MLSLLSSPTENECLHFVHAVVMHGYNLIGAWRYDVKRYLKADRLSLAFSLRSYVCFSIIFMTASF